MELVGGLTVDAFLRSMVFGVSSFALAMLITPIYTHIAFKYQWWKKPRTKAVTGEAATVFQSLHGHKHKRNIPTAAGVVFIAAVSLLTLTLNLERSQTWLPLAALLGAGLIGFADDMINIQSVKGGIAGMQAKMKSLLIFIVSLACGWWFYAKLEVTDVIVPFIGNVELGWLIIPLFVLVVISTANAVNISDGLDGLAGGLSVIAFGAYSFIAFMQGQPELVAFCMTVVGALLSYTWFNINPARFFMGDSGSFALGASLGVIAMMTDTVLLLPVIGAVFVVEAASSLIQILSKKLRGGKKIFKIAPVHHHFEASGWPETKVTMRFWLLGVMCAVSGVILYLMEFASVS